MNCSCGECAVCRGEKKPLFPRAAWSDAGRLRERIDQAEVSVMAEERQAQRSFNWASVGFSMALMVQVSLSAGCFPVASVYGGPPPRTPSPQPSGQSVPPAPTASPSAHVDPPRPIYGLPPKPLKSPTPQSQLTPVEKQPNEVYGAPPKPVNQPLQPKSPNPGVTPVEKEPNDVYGLPPRPQVFPTAQPLQPKPVVPEGSLTPGPEPTRRIYGMPRRDPK